MLSIYFNDMKQFKNRVNTLNTLFNEICVVTSSIQFSLYLCLISLFNFRNICE